MRTIKYTLIFFVLITGHLNAERIVGTISSTVLDGQDVEYIVTTPNAYDLPFNKDKIYPVIYGLHGSNGQANDYTSLTKMYSEIAQRYPVVVASFTRTGINGDMEAFFWEEFVPFVETNYRAGGSQGKRALIGFSAGAGMSNRLMVEDPDFFSSVVMQAGGTNQGGISTLIDNNVELPPMYFICGDQDTEGRQQGVLDMGEFLTSQGVYHETWIVKGAGHDWEMMNDTSPTIIAWQYQYFFEGGAMWRGEYPIIEEHYADTGGFLGTIYIESDPWVYSYRLSGWLYLPEYGDSEIGAWAWIMK